MKDPTDAQLLEFVARFAGWNKIGRDWFRQDGTCFSEKEFWDGKCPDYLNDLNAWHSDVWPKIESSEFIFEWALEMEIIMPMCGLPALVNADARSRCLALYRALEGKLP